MAQEGGALLENMWVSLSKGFPGRKEIREGWRRALSVFWVPQQHRISSQDQEPDNAYSKRVEN